jgi:hypothetical protein
MALTDAVASIDPKFSKGYSTRIDICPKSAIKMVEKA